MTTFPAPTSMVSSIDREGRRALLDEERLAVGAAVERRAGAGGCWVTKNERLKPSSRPPNPNAGGLTARPQPTILTIAQVIYSPFGRSTKFTPRLTSHGAAARPRSRPPDGSERLGTSQQPFVCGERKDARHPLASLRGLRVVLDGALDLERAVGAGKTRDEVQRHVDASA
ncbi:MAG TPA: hypothetical protein VGR11_11165, partial [Solirubrobacteraceae bacterium]|nr:hypothetical protein [Solirubrobacteraceae bacterium]